MNKIVQGMVGFWCFLCIQMLSGQEVLWKSTLGGSQTDLGVGLVNTNDGCYGIVGTTRSRDGDIDRERYDADLWFCKVNSKGMILWQKYFGGTYNEEGAAIDYCKDGGFLLVGSTESRDSTLKNHGKKDIYVVRMDALGSVLWQRCFGGSGNEEGKFGIATQDGGFLVGGSTGSKDGDLPKNQGGTDFWVLKLNHKGSIQWQSVLGGMANEVASCAIELSDGFLVIGSTDSDNKDIPENKGKTDYFVVKYDRTGRMLWSKTYGGESFEEPHGAILTKQQTALIIGTTFSQAGDIRNPKGGGDLWLLELDTKDGKILWSQNYGGAGDEGANMISTCFDGNYLVCGMTNSLSGDFKGTHKGLYDAFVMKLNKKQIIWSKTFGGKNNDSFFAVREIPSGDYIAMGFTESNDGDIQFAERKGGVDLWISTVRDPIHPPQAISLTPTTVTGYIRDKTTQNFLPAEVYLMDESTGSKFKAATSNAETGIYQVILPDTHRMSLGFFSLGYIFKTHYIKVEEHQRYSEIRLDVELEKLKVGTITKLNNIEFDIGKHTLRPSSYPELDRLAQFLKMNKTVRIRLNGHTDATGAPETKQKLSEMRALEVKIYLMKQGIEPHRLETKGYGMSKPLVEEVDEESRQKNRRVEFEILAF